MSGVWVPEKSLIAARNDLGLYSGSGRCQEYTDWQTRHRIRCSPFCASALSMWLSEGGYVFDDNHVWGDRFEWNVTAIRQWAEREGLYRNPGSYRVKAGDGIIMSFTMRDQHIGIGVSQGAVGTSVATIEGNTSGGRVLGKVRHIGNVQGIVAFTESGQLKEGVTPPTPGEVKKMGQVAAVIVPGAKQQNVGVLAGRWPTVDAFQNTDGTWQMRGANGVVLEEGTTTMGVSVHKLGRLAKPITSIQARVDAQGNWLDKAIIATASDFGTFTVHVKKINYTV